MRHPRNLGESRLIIERERTQASKHDTQESYRRRHADVIIELCGRLESCVIEGLAKTETRRDIALTWADAPGIDSAHDAGVSFTASVATQSGQRSYSPSKTVGYFVPLRSG